MYAVISTGGKQYRLKQGDLIKVESLKGAVGDKVVFDEVLALGDEEAASFGSPLVDGAQVVGTIVEHGKGVKVKVLKFKRRKMYRKKTGHRQRFTSVKIESIVGGGSKTAPAEKKAQPKKTATPTVESDVPKGGKKVAKERTGAVKKKAAAPKKAKPAAKKPATRTAKSSTASPAKTKAKPKSEPKETQE
jgi:large subunit ribosomal protein L21